MKTSFNVGLIAAAVLAVAGVFARAEAPRSLNPEQREFFSGDLKKSEMTKTLLFIYIYDVNAPKSTHYLDDRKKFDGPKAIEEIFDVKTLNMANSKHHDVGRDLGQVANAEQLPVCVVLSPAGNILYWSQRYNMYEPDMFTKVFGNAMLQQANGRSRRKEPELRKEAFLVYEAVCKLSEKFTALAPDLDHLYMMKSAGYVTDQDLGVVTRRVLKEFGDKKEAEVSARAAELFNFAEEQEKKGDTVNRDKFLKSVIRMAPNSDYAKKSRKKLDKDGVQYFDPLEDFKLQLKADQSKETTEMAPSADSGEPTPGTQPQTEVPIDPAAATNPAANPAGTPNAKPEVADNPVSEEQIRARNEKKAAAILATTTKIMSQFNELGKCRLEKLIADFPGTKAAADAGNFLK